jgi:NSS family neurotransmitter:Na+ symporter
LLPVGALLTSLLVGWRLDRQEVNAAFGDRGAVRVLLVVLLKYVCPIAIAAVLISAI